MEFNKLKKKGFTLIELSVVMTVIGITIAGALTLATKKLESDKINETQNKLDLIEQSLRVFLVDNQRLPCPADGELSIENSSFGVEATTQINLLVPTCASTNFATSNTIITGGVVPVKSLNLEDDIMFDGWGRRFTYSVDSHFAISGTPNGTNSNCDGSTSEICFQYTDEGAIVIRDYVAPTGSVDFIADDVIYVLISHGRNGSGGFNYFGSPTRLTASAETKEQENAEPSTAPHTSYDDTFIDNAIDNNFDDIVRYKTKAQMVIDTFTQTGDSTDIDQGSSVCMAALAEAQGINDICASANDVATCQALAIRFHRMCLADFP